jgi:hypothetical protein
MSLCPYVPMSIPTFSSILFMSPIELTTATAYTAATTGTATAATAAATGTAAAATVHDLLPSLVA